MTIYLLEYLYHDLKNEGLCNKIDIFNIIQMAGKLKSLNCELYEVAGEIGRLNSIKSNLERDLDDLTKRIGEYDAMLLERSQQARHLKVLSRVDVYPGWLIWDYQNGRYP